MAAKSNMPEVELSPEWEERDRRRELQGRTREVQTSSEAQMWTEDESPVNGVSRYRPMTDDEVSKYKKAKDKSRVKVQPTEIEGKIP